MEKSAQLAKPFLSVFAEFLNAIAGFAWPALFFVLLFLLRHQFAGLLAVTAKKIESSTDIEFGSIKLKGALITQSGDVIRNESSNTHIVSATQEDVTERHHEYERTRNLMVVHTIKPAQPSEAIDGWRVFDVSVFLHPHRNFGKLNDVRSVTYFFGDKWGKGKHGSKFSVESANDQFALTAQMYGSCLCVADIEFQDGVHAKVFRYIDVEMAPVYGVALKEAREGIF